MNIVIEYIGFALIETTSKAALGKAFKATEMEVHYIAFPSQKHEVRGTITLPYNEHIYLPEIARQIAIQTKY